MVIGGSRVMGESKEERLHFLWKELLRKRPNLALLEEVMIHVPLLREKAAAYMLRNYGKNLALIHRIHIMQHVPLFRVRIAQKLMRGSISEHTLVWIIEHVPEVRYSAWRQLINTSPSVRSILDVMRVVPDFRIHGISILLARDTQDRYALTMMLEYASTQEIALSVIKKILSYHSNSAPALRRVIVERYSTPMLRKEAVAALVVLKDNDTESLFLLLKYAPSLRKEVWGKIEKGYFCGETRTAIAERVIKEIPSLRRKARNMIRTTQVVIQDILVTDKKN